MVRVDGKEIAAVPAAPRSNGIANPMSLLD